jgi:hypothetical protein
MLDTKWSGHGGFKNAQINEWRNGLDLFFLFKFFLIFPLFFEQIIFEIKCF